MIEIFDNVLSNEEQNEIEDFFTKHWSHSCNQFPWYLSGDHTVNETHYHQLKTKNTKEYLQFCHLFYDKNIHPINYPYYKSPYFKPIQVILNNYPIQNLTKIKVNFQPRCETFLSDEHNTPHVDSQKPHNVFLYYVNDSDGDTFIFNSDMSIKKRIEPKKGRLVCFDGSFFHAGSHPSKTDKRIVINFNSKKKTKNFLL